MTASVSKLNQWLYSGLLFATILMYRMMNVLILDTQFDPDEYWQTLEPAYCLAFSTEHNCAFTWEWTRRMETRGGSKPYLGWIEEALQGPVRSFVPILPTYFLYKILKMAHFDTTWMIAKAPLLLNAVIVAAPIDFAVFHISKFAFGRKTETRQGLFHKVENWALLASITNWFNGYALVRTYSNSMETSLLAIGMAILCPELFGSFQDTAEFKVRLIARIAFLLGGVSVVIRFTALAAWVPMGLIICARRKSLRSSFYYLWHLCILPGLAGVIFGCIVDRIFYGFWAIPFLGSFHFNVLLGNGKLYGTHPWFWYFLAGLPAIAGILTPLFLFETYACFRRRRKDQLIRWLDRPQDVLLAIIAVYVSFHSISAHKEFRFILPILPLVCILAGNSMHLYYEKKPSGLHVFRRRKLMLFSLLILFNYPHLIFLCTSHQGAPIKINTAIAAYIADFKQAKSKDAQMPNLLKPISIHYLMGCHSTPLYSHLHIPLKEPPNGDTVLIDAWHLDCSPKCRSDASILCESDRFSSDPLGFISQEYGISAEACTYSEDETCKDNSNLPARAEEQKKLPKLLALFEEDLYKNGSIEMRDLLASVGMREMQKFRHTVKGVSFVRPCQRKDDNGRNDEATIIALPALGVRLKIEYYHMILFKAS